MKQERKETLMALQIGLFVPQGWRMDLLGIADPVEAYETMTRVAQEVEALGYHLIWLSTISTPCPPQRRKSPLSAGPVGPHWPAIPNVYALGKWSPATAIATRHCRQRWPRL
jgi:hypothetical protein